jgi:hypothetical protein
MLNHVAVDYMNFCCLFIRPHSRVSLLQMLHEQKG